MVEVTLKQLLEAGCHFGHKADRWHPKAEEFIYQVREGIHIIDLVKTKAGLDAAVEFIYNTAKNGGTVLFVGTKRQAAAVVKEQATAAGAPYISQRWIGGFLTNWEQVHKNLEKIRRMTEEEKNDTWKKYPKHERMKLSRYLGRLNYFYGGVVALMSPPTAIMIVDIKREDVAVREAKKMSTPVVGVVDTNSDPTDINYPIPANDDAVGSVRLLIESLTAAYKEGREWFEKNKEDSVKREAAGSDEPMARRAESVKKEESPDEKRQASRVKDEKKKVIKAAVDVKSEETKAENADDDKKEVKEAKEVKKDEKPKAASAENSGEPKKKRGRPKKSDTAVSSRAGSPGEGTPTR